MRITPRTSSIAALCLTVGILAACEGNTREGIPDTPGTRAFWSALLSQRYEDLPTVMAALAEEADNAPDEPYLAEAYAIAILWRISEAEREPDTENPAALLQLALEAETYLDRARELRPDDPVIATRYAALKIGIGNALGDVTRVEQGVSAMDQAVADYPEFASFNRAQLFFSLPSGHPAAAARVEDFWRQLDACAGERVDREAYDVGEYLDNATSVGPKRVCWNTPHTPHGIEGFFVFMGDALVKSGDAEAALMVYENARRSPDYAAWPFQSLLDERIDQADEWVERFADSDATNDPALIAPGPYACAVCHAAE